jgi:hypothetical protein
MSAALPGEPVPELVPATGVAPEPSPGAASATASPEARPHLVVVTTRAVTEAEAVAAPADAVLATRFWHPRDRQWSENYFASLEHALRLFIDESGWELLQQQDLDGLHAHEMIFAARRSDFAQQSTEQILHDIGLTPDGVADMLDRADQPDPER